MTNAKLETFRKMVEANPRNVLARFGLANEAAKEGLLEEARDQYRAYLGGYDDEGNGWQRLAEVLVQLGETAEAKDALRRGMEASQRFGHHGMMQELEVRLEELDRE